jgi:hypothetical protein
MAERGRDVRVQGAALDRRAAAARGAEAAARRAKLDALASALAAHDPERIVAAATPWSPTGRARS